MLGLVFNHMMLAQYNPVFFSYNRDLSELFIIATGLPKFMIAHPGSFLIADSLLFVLPLVVVVVFLLKGKFSTVAGVLFTLYIGFYFMLANIFIQYHEEPYLVYLIFSFLFISNKPVVFYNMLALCRYYFLYIFFSAAVWKLSRGAVFNLQEMSNILVVQHNDVLNSDCHSFSCNLYFYLIDHPVVSRFFYIGAFCIEASFLAGFFTARFDKLLFLFFIVFLVFDHLLMRIPYWSILFAGFPLLLEFKGKIVRIKIA
jgi:hypothetical protein